MKELKVLNRAIIQIIIYMYKQEKQRKVYINESFQLLHTRGKVLSSFLQQFRGSISYFKSVEILFQLGGSTSITDS